MRVVDPFMGSGTTAIAAFNLDRIGVGMDLSAEYRNLAINRFNKKKMNDNDYIYLIGDSTKDLYKLQMADYIVTSPPYHNILRNKNSGTRSDNSEKGYRNGSRQGIEYYSELPNDLGNQETYEEFINLLKKVMQNCFSILEDGKYCSIIMSDFTVNKKEVCVQADIINLMCEIGFEFVGTTILLQDNKPLYPFGYPFSYKINHMHQNIMNFRKRNQQ